MQTPISNPKDIPGNSIVNRNWMPSGDRVFMSSFWLFIGIAFTISICKWISGMRMVLCLVRTNSEFERKGPTAYMHSLPS